ncbi:MAG: YggT family protein [Bdellovibrionota bacterium]|jgi:YggT family protein
MILLGNILIAIGNILNSLLLFLMILIIARVVVSWVSADPSNVLVRIIVQSTEPIFNLFGRRRLVFGSIDFTPIAALLVISFLQLAIVPSLVEYGVQIKKASMSNITLLSNQI